jgi:YegS/Rv2252/BmrU family lipid kinase
MNRRALLLVNRFARQGARLDEVADCLRASGLDVVAEPLGEDASSAELIRRHRDAVSAVVIGGGDGTLNAAAVALVEAGLPLGVVPLGTANDLARTLGLPTDPAEACRVIAAGRTRTIDLGWVNGKHFFNAASVGLSVEVARRLTRESKGRWGVLAYLATAAGVLRYARPFRAEIRCGDAVHPVRTVQVTVGNGRHYGGGMTVAETAAIDDGRLDLYSLEVDRWWRLLRLLPALRRGSLSEWPGVRALSGSEFEVLTRRPRPVSADGEVVTSTPARFRVVRQALSVFVPEEKTSEGPGSGRG